MAAPLFFPVGNIFFPIFIVSMNYQTLLTARVETLIRKGGKTYQMSAHSFQVFGNLTEAPIQLSIIPVEILLPN